VPWRESSVVNERMRFVVRLEEGERMSDLCREFGISRKTGYKHWKRYEEEGPEGLFDVSRRPHRTPHRTPDPVEGEVVALRRKYPTWGPRKLRAWLERKRPGIRWPSTTTISVILRRQGLVAPRKRVRHIHVYDAPLATAEAPHDLWCADFKGQFRLGNGVYCYPLTISDLYSRSVLSCEGLEGTDGASSRLVFERAFREHGLPSVIRTDSGSPFASRGLFGLSRLSVWWLRLGIVHERIQPGHPEQNGTHERMHLTLKKETTRPAAANFLQQQERFDAFLERYNQERPHEALGLKTPSSYYGTSPRAFPKELPEPEYPLHDRCCTVWRSGHIHFGEPGVTFFLSEVLAGERLGLREVDGDRWLVSFVSLDLGTINFRTRAFEPLTTNPAPKAEGPQGAQS